MESEAVERFKRGIEGETPEESLEPEEYRDIAKAIKEVIKRRDGEQTRDEASEALARHGLQSSSRTLFGTDDEDRYWVGTRMEIAIGIGRNHGLYIKTRASNRLINNDELGVVLRYISTKVDRIDMGWWPEARVKVEEGRG